MRSIAICEPAEPLRFRKIMDDQRILIYRHLAWINALRLSLRGQPVWPEIATFLPAEESETAKHDFAAGGNRKSRPGDFGN